MRSINDLVYTVKENNIDKEMFSLKLRSKTNGYS